MDEVLGDPRITMFGLFIEATTATRAVLDRAAEQWGGFPASPEILLRLARSEDQRLRMSDLAAQCDMSPSGLSRAVDRLGRDGLVRRAACPEDARGAYAVLTAKGNRLIVRAMRHHVEDVQHLFVDVLTPTELKQLEAVTRKLRDRHRPEYTAGA